MPGKPQEFTSNIVNQREQNMIVLALHTSKYQQRILNVVFKISHHHISIVLC